VSDYATAVRELLERELYCRGCGAMNCPTVRTIRVDVNGVACCGNCGRGGDVTIFQPPKGDRHA
jgi:transcription elongation factor Elf1